MELSWTKVAARIDSLIQKDRFLPQGKGAVRAASAGKGNRRVNAKTKTIPSRKPTRTTSCCFQVGDFFEMYGEDAKQAAELLTSTYHKGDTRRWPCCYVRVPHNLEMYVENLRDKYDVTIAEAPDFRGERHIYTPALYRP